MKMNVMLAAVFSLSVFAFAASAQDKVANFSGTWNLNVGKSKLDERSHIESQTLTVTQTDKDIKVETATKHAPPPADKEKQDGGGMGGGQRGGGQMGGAGRRGGGMMGGDGTTTYSLDGKETKTEVSGPMGSMPVSLKGKLKGGKLELTRNSTFSGPMGDVSISSKESWELSADGSALTVNSERTSPRGTNTSTMVYTKRS